MKNILFILFVLLASCISCDDNNKVNQTRSNDTTTKACPKKYIDSLKVDIIENKNSTSYNELSACHSYEVDSNNNIIIYAKIMAEEGDGFASLEMVEYFLSSESSYFFSNLGADELVANFKNLGEDKKELVIKYLMNAVSEETLFSNRYYDLLKKKYPDYFKVREDKKV